MIGGRDLIAGFVVYITEINQRILLRVGGHTGVQDGSKCKGSEGDRAQNGILHVLHGEPTVADRGDGIVGVGDKDLPVFIQLNTASFAVEKFYAEFSFQGGKGFADLGLRGAEQLCGDRHIFMLCKSQKDLKLL